MEQLFYNIFEIFTLFHYSFFESILVHKIYSAIVVLKCKIQISEWLLCNSFMELLYAFGKAVLERKIQWFWFSEALCAWYEWGSLRQVPMCTRLWLCYWRWYVGEGRLRWRLGASYVGEVGVGVMADNKEKGERGCCCFKGEGKRGAH